MARAMDRNPRNAPGGWFVDTRCIDCGASPDVAPDLIREDGDACVFYRQPASADEIRQAWLAVDVCPTKSVGAPAGLARPERTFPWELEPGVMLCGFNDRSSYGAHSWLVRHPEGNLLVDSPTYSRRLTGPLDELGGISTVLLTHRDDVADADNWADRYGAEVWIHADDSSAAPFATEHIEGADTTRIRPGVDAVPVPGHTRGSVVYVVDGRFAFTGDSLAWDRTRNSLRAFRNACWYSWEAQRASLARLAEHRFTRVFAGHGSWSPAIAAGEMRRLLLELVARM
jgi:glyoxylase-like metal-dependent hydrolase (beta-lactamase superfamily II)/ferredoxin